MGQSEQHQRRLPCAIRLGDQSFAIPKETRSLWQKLSFVDVLSVTASLVSARNCVAWSWTEQWAPRYAGGLHGAQQAHTTAKPPLLQLHLYQNLLRAAGCCPGTDLFQKGVYVHRMNASESLPLESWAYSHPCACRHWAPSTGTASAAFPAVHGKAFPASHEMQRFVLL